VRAFSASHSTFLGQPVVFETLFFRRTLSPRATPFSMDTILIFRSGSRKLRSEYRRAGCVGVSGRLAQLLFLERGAFAATLFTLQLSLMSSLCCYNEILFSVGLASGFDAYLVLMDGFYLLQDVASSWRSARSSMRWLITRSLVIWVRIRC
jgi:hypothetical protein